MHRRAMRSIEYLNSSSTFMLGYKIKMSIEGELLERNLQSLNSTDLNYTNGDAIRLSNTIAIVIDCH